MSLVPSAQNGSCTSTKHQPFKLPDDKDIFYFRQTEEAERKQRFGNGIKKKDMQLQPIYKKGSANDVKYITGDRTVMARTHMDSHGFKEFQRNLSLPVHKKNTYSGRIKAKQADLIKKLTETLNEEEKSTTCHTPFKLQCQKMPEGNLSMFKDQYIKKESIHDFVTKKREMFYLEYALTVRKEEIEKIRDTAICEEKKLSKAEKLLEDDVVLFDEFLKENDKKSVEAIKIAEQESKTKLEKIAEIKKVTAKTMAIKSDISKLEDTLHEYKLYKDFLFKLSPSEWQETQKEKRRLSAKLTSATDERKLEEKTGNSDPVKKTSQPDTSNEKKRYSSSRELPPLRNVRSSSRPVQKSTPQSGQISPTVETDSSDVGEEPELYFTEPQQLLDLLSELEEQNLSLIQNSQDAEECLDEFRKNMEQTRKDMKHETDRLKNLIDIMTENIKREIEKNEELKLKARLFNFGKFKTEEEFTLNALGTKVSEVYRSCIGNCEGNLSTLQMLAVIESRLLELLDTMETIPAERIAMAEKAKEKERRIRLREEKLQVQKQHQVERMKKATERTQAVNKRMSGKKLMPRSKPPIRKSKIEQTSDLIDKEKKDYIYFFT